MSPRGRSSAYPHSLPFAISRLQWPRVRFSLPTLVRVWKVTSRHLGAQVAEGSSSLVAANSERDVPKLTGHIGIVVGVAEPTPSAL